MGMSAIHRDRSGRGRSPIRIRNARERSWRATRWQAHPQNQRPRTSVERMVIAKKMSPALTTEYLANSMASDGSSGDTVRPVDIQWAM